MHSRCVLRAAPAALALLVIVGLACGDDDAQGGMGADRDAGAVDAGMDGGHDAGRDSGRDEIDSGHEPDARVADDAGPDAGPACEVARCPAATAAPLPIPYGGEPTQLVQAACCVHEGFDDWSDRLTGECGVGWLEAYGFGPYCAPIVQGERDDTCLDVSVDGAVYQGCRRPDGRCGHLTDGWGCHTMFRLFWSRDADSDPRSPNPFQCISVDAPCTHSSECCEHPNYGGGCFVPEDAGSDGGTPAGVCGNPEENAGWTLLP